MRHCFVINCDSGSASQMKRDGKAKSFFAARTEEMFQKWSDAIGREDKIFKKGKYVCELHFTEEEVIRDFVTILPGGNIHKIPRERPILKEGSIPSIFPKRLTPEKQGTSRKKNSITSLGNDSTASASPFMDEIILPWRNLQSKYGRENMFETILKNYQDLPLVDGWDVRIFPDALLWFYFTNDESFTCRKLILSSNMKFEVLLGEVKVRTGFEIIDIEEIPIVLEVIPKLLPCPGGSSQRSAECEGYIFPKIATLPGPQSKHCSTCKKVQLRNKVRQHRQMERKIRKQALTKKIQSRYKNICRKIKRLQNRMEIITEK